MRHGSLFTGIGGFDLAAEWMGWENIFHCEINPFCQKILKHHFPNAASHSDIKATDFTFYRGLVDILTGGFPCQPYSTAGKRKGKDDERHLWPEMLRAAREIQPPWIVGENVFGIVNWNGGVVFDEVQSDLEAEGYEVQPYVLPACGINAPHKRDRVWFVAHSTSGRYGAHTGVGSDRGEAATSKGERLQWQRVRDEFRGNGAARVASNSYGIGLRGEGDGLRKARFISKNGEGHNWQNFPTQSPVLTGNDGVPSRLDGITFPKWRSESLKGAGNAIVPQLVLQIFKAIEAYEQHSNTHPLT